MMELFQQSLPPRTTWIVEQPVNPNLLCLHTRLELTHAMSEKYKGPDQLPDVSWLRSIFALEGLSKVDVLRHHLRLRKEREASWDKILPALQQALGEESGTTFLEAPEEPNEDRKRLYKTPLSDGANERIVVEGVNEAEPYPWAQEMFAFPGLILTVLDSEGLSLKRGLAFSWEELEPAIYAVLLAE
ncbi:MAG: hypothetical protein EP343_15765 [Deltaproteobacteria bacterium]|nr:MAG: hypothetical protein EP343_15765 [Deltaproteobacteria bacterium]